MGIENFSLDANSLMNFGVLGMWVIYLLWTVEKQEKKQDAREQKLTTVIENNTIALTAVKEKL